MTESARPRPLWTPPPETAEVKREQIKLTASLLNAGAVTCFVASIVGPIITSVPDTSLTPLVRVLLLAAGAVLHLAGRTYIRYIPR